MWLRVAGKGLLLAGWAPPLGLSEPTEGLFPGLATDFLCSPLAVLVIFNHYLAFQYFAEEYYLFSEVSERSASPRGAAVGKGTSKIAFKDALRILFTAAGSFLWRGALWRNTESEAQVLFSELRKTRC